MGFRFEREQALIKLLISLLVDRTLDLPEGRRNIQVFNLRWLQRNIKIRNADHPNVSKILTIIKELI